MKWVPHGVLFCCALTAQGANCSTSLTNKTELSAVPSETFSDMIGIITVPAQSFRINTNANDILSGVILPGVYESDRSSGTFNSKGQQLWWTCYMPPAVTSQGNPLRLERNSQYWRIVGFSNSDNSTDSPITIRCSTFVSIWTKYTLGIWSTSYQSGTRFDVSISMSNGYSASVPFSHCGSTSCKVLDIPEVTYSRSGSATVYSNPSLAIKYDGHHSTAPVIRNDDKSSSAVSIDWSFLSNGPGNANATIRNDRGELCYRIAPGETCYAEFLNPPAGSYSSGTINILVRLP